MAERYGDELAAALPEVDAVAGFGVPVTLGRKRAAGDGDALTLPSLDLLNLPRPPAQAPWAYVKIAEGCDRACGFCAIPQLPRAAAQPRRRRRSSTRSTSSQAQEIVLVAQDLASYGKDRPAELGAGAIVPLVRAVAERVGARPAAVPVPVGPHRRADRRRSAAPASPTSTSRCSTCRKPLLRRMRRWGDGDRFLRRIEDIRDR